MVCGWIDVNFRQRNRCARAWIAAPADTKSLHRRGTGKDHLSHRRVWRTLVEMRRLSLAIGLAVCACDVGDIRNATDATVGGADANGDGGNNCIPAVTPVGDSHRPGESCLDAGCHNGANPGAGAPPFSAAGTLYTNAAGAAGVGGATIVVTDIGGNPVNIPTSANGNFHTAATLPSSYLTRASRCPDDVPMISQATGNCNSAGCHSATGGAGRIHLP